MTDTGSKIIVALDFNNEQAVLDLVSKLDPGLCRLKVGKELFTACGPGIVRKLVSQDYDVFLDLKFHDIPNTVAKALRSAADLGVWMVNVHASGGRPMLEAAAESLAQYRQAPLLIAVTVLTSMQQGDFPDIGIEATVEEQVLRLASLAKESGLQGVVCSAQEAAMLKSRLGPAFSLVTPGIRLPDNDANDQQRIVTPQAAIEMGSDYLVIGRPITQSSEPLKALKQINLFIA